MSKKSENVYTPLPQELQIAPNLPASYAGTELEGVLVDELPMDGVFPEDQEFEPEPELVVAVASLGDKLAEPLVVTMSKNVHTGKVERSDDK